MIEHPLFQRLKTLNLNPNDFMVFGSGPMFAKGIRQMKDFSDFDLWIKDSAIEALRKISKVGPAESWGGEHFVIPEVEIEAFSVWGPKQFTDNNAFEDVRKRAFIVDEIPFASLSDVINWKKAMGRPKDLEHVILIENSGLVR